MSPSSVSNATETTPLLRDQTSSNGCISEPQPQLNAAREAQFQGAPEVQGQIKYIFAAISMGIFLSAADQTIIIASYGKIGSDLNALNLTSWITTSYFLTLTSFQPLYGRLSDIFGRKACLLFAYVVFGTGCLFCGLAQDIKQLIAARVFQGIGGGGMTTVVSILMSDLVPLRDRGLWQGIINIIYATGAGVGAPLGGLLADYIGWRWAFIGQAPICLAAFISVSLLLKLPVKDKGDWRAKLRRIDFLGAVILVTAVSGFLLGMDRGSNVSWSLPITIVSLSVSAVLFIAFVLVEIYVAAEPFAPGHIIFDRTLVACYACNFFSFGGWLAALFFLPLFFQAVDGVSATIAGVRLIPQVCAGVSGSLFAGFMMRWTGKFYWITVFAYGLLTVKENQITNSDLRSVSNAAPEDQAVVTACSYLFRSLGSIIGLSLSATVVQQILRERLRSALRDSKDIDRIVQGVRQSLEFIKTLDPQIRDIVRRCYGTATNLGFAFMIGIVFFALFSSFFIREQKLSR
ncbi:hypothetical protein T310_8428 [Rasamsonia emersonii CBS 393.64]|uniref:Major facilitator superfamily (MFS) profile domain-containing protein n=1 Tax=Rasamsonia emersonii (strain ATCC 16479 / CBS 393.64 / IMI 116815) TaxID=1408163 RepID=A0A0F4YIF7_RASE3|nr:hypothetical protein T310_8428 [Rasamsonia emersonii CBS 393.64]KKA17631.1 hypothetical protein T310_8428 [Rasamsonia emersonii CBS 393.64]